MQSIILASQSPRRKQLLEWAEIDFEVVVIPTDETFPAGLQVEEVAVHIARQKAVHVQKHLVETSPSQSQKIILAADTIVVLDDRIIGKPKDREDAISILTYLSASTHRVITGVVLFHHGTETSFSDITYVEFHSLNDKEIIFYVDKYKPYDKAGAYAIQEWIGVVGIKSVQGDFYNVMGLPVSRVIQKLKKINSLSF